MQKRPCRIPLAPSEADRPAAPWPEHPADLPRRRRQPCASYVATCLACSDLPKGKGLLELKSRPTEPPWNPQALGGTLAGRPGFEPADSVQCSPSQLPAGTAPRGHSALRADARACWEGGLPWRGPVGSCRTPNPKTLLGSRPPRPPAPCTRAPVGQRGPVRAKGAEGSKLPFQRETFQAGN